jgi:hypothetical protein
MPDKIDPVLAWKFAEKLLREKDLESFDDASDEDIERQMREAGIKPKRIPTAAELMAAAERARVRRSGGVVPLRIAPRPAPVRQAWVVWLVAAAVGAGLVALVVERREVVALFHHEPEPIGPDNDFGPRPAPTPVERATALRKEAFAACGSAFWALCMHKLDEAQTLDPAGETAAQVQEARKAVHDGLNPEPKEKPKPK